MALLVWLVQFCSGSCMYCPDPIRSATDPWYQSLDKTHEILLFCMDHGMVNGMAVVLS